MIFLFIILASSEKILAIDFGSKYLKFGSVDINNKKDKIIILNHKNIYPSAISIEEPNKNVDRLNSSLLNHVNIVTGYKAIPMIHRNAKSGIENILSCLISSQSKPNLATVGGEQLLLNLFFHDVIDKIIQIEGTTFDKAVITFPTFFTDAMIRNVTEPLKRVKSLNFQYAINTFEALTTLYSEKFLHKYKLKPRKVLFISAGAMYTEMFVVEFTWNNYESKANCLSYQWTDKFGSEILEKLMSDLLEIHISQAIKFLEFSNDIDYAPNEKNEFERLLNNSLKSCGLVDEVQFVGGLSIPPFMENLLRESVYKIFPFLNQSYTADSFPSNDNYLSVNSLNTSSENETHNNKTIDFLKDIDPIEGIIEGSMKFILRNEKNHGFPLYLYINSTSNIDIKYGNHKMNFCRQNEICNTNVTFQNVSLISDHDIIFEFESNNSLSDSSHIIERFHLDNMTQVVDLICSQYKLDRKEVNGNSAMQLILKSSEPYLKSVSLCYNFQCYPIHTILNDEFKIDKESENLYNEFSNLLIDKRVHKDFMDKVRRAIQRMKTFIQESTIDEKTLHKFNKLEKEYESGAFEKMSSRELDRKAEEFKQVCLLFGFRF